MPFLEVLKFGSSVLRSAADLPIAVDEIYRSWRNGFRVIAVVSAFEGTTDRLFAEAARLFGVHSPEATAAFVSHGEEETAFLLVHSLGTSGIPARFLDPTEIGLLADGTPLESFPKQVNALRIHEIWEGCPILVLPGFYGIDQSGLTVLFGRGGSDLSALFLAHELRAHCRLLKDVRGVFAADPSINPTAHRFTSMSWSSAIEVAGPLVQPKALRYAQLSALPFEVGRANESMHTSIGSRDDAWEAPKRPPQPLRIALAGCGVVGRGVYERLKSYPDRFKAVHVIVRDLKKYTEVDEATDNLAVALDSDVDVVIVCFGGTALAYQLMSAAANAGKFVVTANKAAMAAYQLQLAPFAAGANRRLWGSAAVGGAVPVLETLATLTSPIVEIRGTVNGTCGAVLDSLQRGGTWSEAIAEVQAAGFAEANPARDLSGRDSADKLSILIQAAFDEFVSPESILTVGIDSIGDHSKKYRLIARARRTIDSVIASVKPELPEVGSYLAESVGPENRLEIELADGQVVRLWGKGAGRWPTTVSIMGDLHEVARRLALE
jgi:homoserine dehydrogenase